ncbi:MAG TPA: hypothetical protein VFH27_03565, partial [Longimicrobiaceae bacterium]|nr:hypothetical protein [Longimicrobiaceae bacterium]
VGLDFNDVPGPHGTFQGGASLRHVNRYYFRSGINMGQIPNFTGMDFSLGYRMPQYHSLINLNVANAFSCVGNFTYASSLPATDPRRNSDPLNKNPISEDRSCGFNKRHSEMIKMPEVGTMVFLGVQFQTR